MESKICKKCGVDKPLVEYYNHNTTKDGKRPSCKECHNINANKWVSENQAKNLINKKNWRDKNTDKTKKYYENNKETIINKNKAYNKSNPEVKRKSSKTYRENNKETIKVKNRAYVINKLKTDPLYKLKHNISNSIRNSFKEKNKVKTSKTHEILGISSVEFKLYIESLWDPWMNWDNYGLYNGELNYGWDIDHKIPLSSAITEEDIIRLNHYTNLKPLCSHTNRNIKRDNY